MNRTKPILLATILLSTSACTGGTEGGNPSATSPCSSSMFGLIEGDFTVPANAPGIPLAISESRGPDASFSAELVVSRNGSQESDWQLVDHRGGPLDLGEPLSGSVSLRLANPLAEGDRIVVSRRVSCKAPTGVPFELPEQKVAATIGPEIPVPATAGELRVTHGADSSTVVLTLSPEIAPWRHTISGSSLQVGEAVLGDSSFVHGDDRDLDWALPAVDCRPCPTDRGDGPPLVCYQHLWSPGQYDLIARVQLLGGPDLIESNTVSTRFETTRCSQ